MKQLMEQWPHMVEDMAGKVAKDVAEKVAEEVVDRVAEAFTQKVDLSSVSQSAAMDLLDTLELKVVQLTWETAIEMEGLADRVERLPALTQAEAEFKMEDYPDERAATLPFQEHLKGVVDKLCASQLGQWVVEDIRMEKLRWLKLNKSYQGCMDLGILPAGAPKGIAQLRMGFELKHTEQHKELFKTRHPQAEAAAPSQGERPVESVAWEGNVKGQSIMELLCSFRRCEWPLDVVVTDGRQYHALRLRGRDVQVVLNMSAVEGLRLIAARLQTIDPSPNFSFAANTSTADPNVVVARKALDSTSVEQQARAVAATVRMWHNIQQLASNEENPEDLICEFFHHHPRRQYELPAAIQSMYA